MIGNDQIVSLRTVYHVGSRRAPTTRPWSSMEGPGLSVTLHPDEWREIAELSGPTWRLRRGDHRAGRFFDMYSDRRKLLAQARKSGWITRGTIYVVSSDDDETGDRRSMWFAYRDEAQAEYEDRVDSGQADATLEEQPGWYATPALNDRWAEAFRSDLDLVMVEEFAVHQIVEAVMALDGLWWSDRLDPINLSAPRGVIFPTRLNEWAWRKVTNE